MWCLHALFVTCQQVLMSLEGPLQPHHELVTGCYFWEVGHETSAGKENKRSMWKNEVAVKYLFTESND